MYIRVHRTRSSSYVHLEELFPFHASKATRFVGSIRGRVHNNYFFPYCTRSYILNRAGSTHVSTRQQLQLHNLLHACPFRRSLHHAWICSVLNDPSCCCYSFLKIFFSHSSKQKVVSITNYFADVIITARFSIVKIGIYLEWEKCIK